MNPSLFEDMRSTLAEAIELTVASILAYAERYQHWALAYSGGKDSSATVLRIQDEVNETAITRNRPLIDLISGEEEARICELIDANTWPRGWDGTEAEGDALIDKLNADGTLQPLIAGLEVA